MPEVSDSKAAESTADHGLETDIGAGEFYPSVGVGPHPLPWPQGEQWDTDLLANGDRRNVVDKYRYWTVQAIKADLEKTRTSLHIAIENWHHDLNIGSIVRTANAFNVAAVHIIGRRAWNRRGAMVTDKYMHVLHHPTPDDFQVWASANQVAIIGLEQSDMSVPLGTFQFPESCALLLGNEGVGLTDEGISICETLVEIPQFGSTRSINASAAGAIAMWAWYHQH